MSWFTIGILVVVGFLVLKFLVKPLFKVVALVALVLIAWWLYKGF
ncbi:MAG: hypothetical protein WCK46_00195 [Candidatus Adlerbacteria bacterium]